MYLILFTHHPGGTCFNMYTENMQQQFTCLDLLPCLKSSSPP